MVKKNLILLSIHILSILTVARLIGIPVSDSARNTHDPSKLKLALSIMPGDALNHYAAGLLSHYDIINPDMEMAIKHYETALRKNPLLSRAWFHLARADKLTGRTEDSLSAIENFYRLNPGNPERIWDTGVFHLVESGRIDRALAYFKKYIELKPESQSRVYDVCGLMKVPNAYIINNLLTDSASLYPVYLNYLIQHERTDEAIDFWKSINHDYVDEENRIGFCNFLIAKEEYDEAYTLWGKIYKEPTSSFERNLLSNGNFESDIKNGCLGWRVGRAEGANIYVDGSVHSGGYRSLGISFDGKHNLDISVIRQYVLLEPGTEYLLSADIKADNLTTTNGLFFEARGLRCEGLYEKSEVIIGTTLWKAVSVKFSVPEECNIVDITLRRQRSRKFNNKIDGNAWVDEVVLIKAEQ